MSKWLQPTGPTPPGTSPGLPHIRTVAMSCTVDHGGAKCPWDSQPAPMGVFHMEYKDGLSGDLFEWSKRLMGSASRSQGPGPIPASKPGVEWKGPTTEEWLRRIGGKDVPWIR